ncbi:MAG: hypothetical protein KJO51_05630 [Gramella sp.]|nr:hypothetical protein [Christiangramia sp.]
MEIIFLLISGLFGAVVTFYLNNRLKLGGVMASSLVAVIAAVFFLIFPSLVNKFLTTHIPPVIMGASFIGMATYKVTNRYWVMAISGIVFSSIYLLSSSFFEGFGGSLGTTAAISLCAVLASKKLKNPDIPLPKSKEA